jgi:Protein of unknown function (DUF2855)
MAQRGGWRFQVRKSDLKDVRVVDEPPPSATELMDGEILVAIERFSFSANNVLYALLGDQLKHWSLYPATDEAFGVATAWGLGRVIAARHGGIDEGERIYGLFPMGSHAVLRPADLTPLLFRDGTPYRQAAARPYNEYYRVRGNIAFEGSDGDYGILLRPIFLVSWLAAQVFQENGFYGARLLLITSASSKTAMALAFSLRDAGAKVGIAGMTSAGNQGFVENCGLYDRVVAYDELEQLDTTPGAVLYDVAGDGSLKARIHHHFGDRLKHSAQIGFAHWDAPRVTEALPGPQPELFFAPDHIAGLRDRWGLDEFERRRRDATNGYIQAMIERVNIRHVLAPDEIASTFVDFLAGSSRPEGGYVFLVNA